MQEGCGKKLAAGQWWWHCGETDMGQTLPALCTECGGEYVLADDQGFDFNNKEHADLLLNRASNIDLDECTSMRNIMGSGTREEQFERFTQYWIRCRAIGWLRQLDAEHDEEKRIQLLIELQNGVRQ